MIVATRHGNVALESRGASLGALLESTGRTTRSSAVAVNASDVAGLPAFQQAIRIAATSLAKHEVGVYRGRGADRRQITGSWQARFFANPPNERYPWFFAWEGTEASLTARNNAYWLKQHDAGRVAAIYVIHPDHVVARWNKQLRRAEYRVLLDTGGWSDWLTSQDILHFRAGAPDPGAAVAPSPIELHRRTWATALAKNRAESNYYDRGITKTTAVIFPEEITPEQAERWKHVYLGPGGIDNNSSVKVFGGNPTIETIGLSLADSQYIESQNFSIYDAGRILGVPPSLLWAASDKGDKPITPEHEEDRWFRYGLEPRRERIQQWIAADPSFFGPGARDRLMFMIDGVRGDLRTESETLVHEVQAGILLPDEARAKRGLDPLPDGQGQIAQITPVGGAPNPTLPPATATRERDLIVLNTPAQPRGAQPSGLEDGLRELGASLLRVAEAHAAPPAPVIRNEFTIPPQPAAHVHVDVHVPEERTPPAEIVVEPTPVTVENHVHVPEQPAPVVHVAAPDGAQPDRKVTFERSMGGQLKGAKIEDV